MARSDEGVYVRRSKRQVQEMTVEENEKDRTLIVRGNKRDLECLKQEIEAARCFGVTIRLTKLGDISVQANDDESFCYVRDMIVSY